MLAVAVAHASQTQASGKAAPGHDQGRTLDPVKPERRSLGTYTLQPSHDRRQKGAGLAPPQGQSCPLAPASDSGSLSAPTFLPRERKMRPKCSQFSSVPTGHKLGYRSEALRAILRGSPRYRPSQVAESGLNRASSARVLVPMYYASVPKRKEHAMQDPETNCPHWPCELAREFGTMFLGELVPTHAHCHPCVPTYGASGELVAVEIPPSDADVLPDPCDHNGGAID